MLQKIKQLIETHNFNKEKNKIIKNSINSINYYKSKKKLVLKTKKIIWAKLTNHYF